VNGDELIQIIFMDDVPISEIKDYGVIGSFKYNLVGKQNIMLFQITCGYIKKVSYIFTY